MTVLTDISILATCAPAGGQDNIHQIENAAVVWEDQTIVWVGKEAELPVDYQTADKISAGGQIVIPGLVDCHTHLAFGGWRGDEFALRVQGKGYLEIARAGGGIASSMRHTRAATEEELIKKAGGILSEMAKLGVTTVECKSGYGLNVETELKVLRVYKKLQQKVTQELVPTFLGAHVIPPEHKENPAEYERIICEKMLPQIQAENLAEFCDVFVEDTAFETEMARRILEAGKKHGLRPKLHVDQLEDGNGALLSAEVGAVSADHLEYSNENGIKAMAEADVVAVSLPLATFYLKQKPMPARDFINAGVAVAVATDFNPGSAPSFHLPMAMTMACIMQGMTPAEVLKGATYYAAKAIDRGKITGSIEVGKRADLAVLEISDINHWLYHLRPNCCTKTIVAGQLIYEKSQ